MKSAAGKRPPDEAHGPGKEAIRPQQLCLGELQNEGAHGHAALPAEVGTTLIQKMTHRSDLKISAKKPSDFFKMSTSIIHFSKYRVFQNFFLNN